jgi:hypothetical protein
MVRFLDDLTGIGQLRKTNVTASSGLLLLMTFSKGMGLIDELERRLAHLKNEEERVYGF